MLPTKAKIGGKIYDINTDYKIGVKCLKVIEDEDLSDERRALEVIYLLFGTFPDDLEEALKKADYYLTCGKEQPKHSEPADMDFDFDKERIEASFRSDYGIDLKKENMHFWEYIQLIEGLTEQSVLSRVREIRGYNLNDIKDPKERERMSRAKENLKIPRKRTKAQQKAIDEFMSYLEGGDDNGN